MESRLYRTYEKTDWESDVKSYLWWISIELELIETDYEKNIRRCVIFGIGIVGHLNQHVVEYLGKICKSNSY